MTPPIAELRQRDRTVTLGETLTVGSEDQRHVDVLGRRKAEELLEQHLARRRRQQVVATHHLCHPLGGIVDDYRQVVGGHAVATLQHDVVDRSAR